MSSALLIVNVSVESNPRKYNLINWHWPVFPLFSSFQFPSSYLSDHSDPLKMSQLSLNVNHRQLNNHHKTSTKPLRNAEAVAECMPYRLLVWSSLVRFSLWRYCFLRDARLTVIPYNYFLCACMEQCFLYRKLQACCHSVSVIIEFIGNAVKCFFHNYI